MCFQLENINQVKFYYSRLLTICDPFLHLSQVHRNQPAAAVPPHTSIVVHLPSYSDFLGLARLHRDLQKVVDMLISGKPDGHGVGGTSETIAEVGCYTG